MKHFVVYHNPEKMGYLADEFNEPCVLTNKPVEGLGGARMWLIQGKGKPRQYFLRGTFTVVSIDRDTDEGFRYRVRGRNGDFFRPAIDITDLPWFKRFKRSQGNFAFGLQRISDQAVIDQLKLLSGVS
jgi:hypothetical protein